jgi:class 3 adenylate cyclase/tetratricopeptide (TPR) repeat protein
MTRSIISCASCGQEIAEGFRFCPHCGAPVDQGLDGSEERKVVTVLFCDLVGFTARSDRADPEDVRAALRPYHSSVRKEIERFGGSVEKFIGDAVMAVFGAPAAHEDDPERAVRAGLRSVQAVSDLKRDYPGLDLSVRIGVNTGEAVVALGARPDEGEGIVSGDVVNTAARLQTIAPADAVVVGEVTYRATKQVIEYEELKPASVKGKAEPLRIWRALSPRGSFGPEVERARTPFIGRQDDLALLQRTYHRTVRESSVQLVTIVGEPGVGKSRLVDEFIRYIDGLPEFVICRRGRSLPYGDGITFWALGEIVKGQARILESDSSDVAEAKLAATIEEFVEDPGEREWIRGRLAPIVGVEDEGSASAERSESVTAWRKFLEAIAATAPLVLVIEDLHWADEALLEFLEHLVDYSSGLPLLLLTTARPELFERRTGWGGGKRNTTTISLAPLTAEETETLLGALLSKAGLPESVMTELLERAGGNPLYAEEFARMLIDRGLLHRRNSKVEVVGTDEIPVPDSVHALISARLDTVPLGRKSMLQDASVIGRVFWSGAVAAMSGVEEPHVRESLHELSRKELVRPSRMSSVRDQAEYSFWHALVRDVAYSQIPRAARSRKHRAAANWIVGLARERIADHAELLAYHYDEARELARAAGATDEAEDLQRLASKYLELAGDRASRLDMRKAATYYERALGLRSDGMERGRLLLKTGDAFYEMGRIAEAEHMAREANRLLTVAGDQVGAGQALIQVFQSGRERGDTSASQAALAEAIEILERQPAGPELASAYMFAAREASWMGWWNHCLQWIERARPLAEELELQDLVVRVMSYRAWALANTGDPEAAVRDLRASVEISLRQGLDTEVLRAYDNLARLLVPIEGLVEAEEMIRKGIELANRRGLEGFGAWMKAEWQAVLVDRGKWDEVLEAADQLLDLGRTAGGSLLEVFAFISRARVLAHRGEVSAAAKLVDVLLPRGLETRSPAIMAPALATAVLVDEARGDVEGALGKARALAKILEESSVPGEGSSVLMYPLRVCAHAADGPLADRLVRTLDRFPISGKLLDALRVAGGAVLAEIKSDWKAAAAMYSESAAQWGSFGSVPERGHALLGAGRCLVSAHDRRQQEAIQILEEARAIFEGLGAAPHLDEVNKWLVSIGVPDRRS